MSLSIKDIIATIVTVGIAYVSYLTYQGVEFPITQNMRVWISIMFVAGLAVCAMTGTPVDQVKKNAMITIASVLGVLAMVIFLWGLITGSKTAVIIMGVDIIALWGVSTLRHMFS